MVRNVHERPLPVPARDLGRLVDALGGPRDALWPSERWPAMRLDRPLAVGARGGHGPIRYRVERYLPGVSVRFRFEGPGGFDGYHEYSVAAVSERSCVLRHEVVMRTRGTARVSWPLVYRPLHDALLEDSLDKATRSLGLSPAVAARWSPWVRLLRAVLRPRSRRRVDGGHP